MSKLSKNVKRILKFVKMSKKSIIMSKIVKKINTFLLLNCQKGIVKKSVNSKVMS